MIPQLGGLGLRHRSTLRCGAGKFDVSRPERRLERARTLDGAGSQQENRDLVVRRPFPERGIEYAHPEEGLSRVGIRPLFE